MLLDVCMFLLPFIFVWLIISAVGYVRARKNNSEKRENAKTPKQYFLSPRPFLRRTRVLPVRLCLSGGF